MDISKTVARQSKIQSTACCDKEIRIMCYSFCSIIVWTSDVERKEWNAYARFRRRTSHEPNRMLMRENKGFFPFAFDSAHVKYGVWTWPYMCVWWEPKNEEHIHVMKLIVSVLFPGLTCVRPTSQNPYPIYDQNLRFLLPYLWPGQKFDTLFMTVAAGTVALNISYEGLLLTVLLIMMKK